MEVLMVKWVLLTCLCISKFSLISEMDLRILMKVKKQIRNERNLWMVEH